jgi:hypothetical protein
MRRKEGMKDESNEENRCKDGNILLMRNGFSGLMKFVSSDHFV